MTHFRDLQKNLTMSLRFLAQRSKIYYDRKRFEEIDFKMKRKAFLLRKNMKIIRKSSKLNHVKIEFFEILRNIKNTNYELKLSESMRLKHSVFYVSLLESADSDTSNIIISNEYIEENEKYEVEDILNTRRSTSAYVYLLNNEFIS